MVKAVINVTVLLLFPIITIADIYKWKDEKGIIHFSDDSRSIPEKAEIIVESKKAKEKNIIKPIPQTPYLPPIINYNPTIPKTNIQPPATNTQKTVNPNQTSQKTPQIINNKAMANILSPIILLLFIVIALKIMGTMIKRETKKEQSEDPYYKRKVLTNPEQILYNRLYKALPDYMILAQVPLSQILRVKKGYNFYQWNNRINRMSVDFTVCRKDSSIVAVIELDDSTHQRKDRQDADAKKDKALNSAGIRIIRYSVNNIPDETTIKSYFQGCGTAAVEETT